MDFRYLLHKKFANMLQALPEDFNVLAMALESTNSGVVITDFRQPDNPIIFCNHAFENLTGYNREEIIGQNCRFLQGKDRVQDSLKLLRESIENGAPVTVELRNYDKNGVLFWNELSIAPVRDSEGMVTHFIGIQNDVTRKKTLETDLMEQIDLLNSRLAKQQKYIRKVEEILFGIMQTSRECLIILDQNLTIIKANLNFYHIFQETEEDLVGKAFESIQSGQWSDQKLHSLLLTTLNEGESFDDFPLYLTKPNDKCNRITLAGSKINMEGMEKNYILLTIRCNFTNEEKSKAMTSLTG